MTKEKQNLRSSSIGSQKWPRLSEAILISAASFLGYLFAFTYQVGFGSVFHIPVAFISISLTEIFLAAGAVGSVMLTVFWWANLVFLPGAPIKTPLGRSALRLSPLILFVGVGIYLFGTKWREWIWYLIPLAAFGVIELGLPLLTQQSKRGYSEKIAAQEELDRQVTSLTDYAAKAIGPTGLMLIVLVLIGVGVSYSAGRASALDQREFLVLPGSLERVVLRTYGDTVVCASIDRKAKQVGNTFFVYKLGAEVLSSGLHLENIGPLHSALR